MATKKTKKPEKVPKSKKGWVWPIPSKRETQGFVGSHGGRDYGLPVGSPLVAPTKGKVVFAGKDSSGYGNLIKIQTDKGETVYLAHLSQINVKPGQSVDPGQLIGKTGNTGNSTGPHLHFEVRAGSKKVDPLSEYGGTQTFSITSGSSKNGKKETPKITGRAGAGEKMAEKAAQGETPAETAQAKMAADIEAIKQGINPYTMITDWIEGLNWGNVIAAIVGILLIVVGVLGLVTGEAAKTALQPVTEAIKA